MYTLDPRLVSYMNAAHAHGASDIHVKTMSPPKIRVNGALKQLKVPPLTAQATEEIVKSTMSEQEWEIFLQTWEKDYSVELPGVGRFRVNAFYTRGTVGMVARLISSTPPNLRSLGVPESISTLARQKNGLIVVSGATGSGKSTTLAGIVDFINRDRNVHIVTIEDPIEIIHADIRASISQRELSADTKDYMTALHSALRQDPDVILIGEMRHSDTVRTAIQAAETGHLVLTTLHTSTAPDTINRILDFFPEREQKQIRITLAETLRGIVCQRLLPALDQPGRVGAFEVLMNTGRVPQTILNPEKGDLVEIMQTGKTYGMQTFDEHLINLVSRGRISEDTARENADNQHDFNIKLKSMRK